jgi:hypothetical protein
MPVNKVVTTVLSKVARKKVVPSQSLKIRNLFFVTLFAVGLTFGLFLSIIVFNYQQKDRNQNIEITFVTPRQAVVFLTTSDETLGYVRYTPNIPNSGAKTETVYQTSSTPSTIHAVVLTDIPLEGAFITLHNDSDSRFLFSTKREIKFDPASFIE